MSECDAASTRSVLTFKSRDRALGGLWVPRAARWRKTWYLRQKNRTRQLPPFPAPIVSCAIACQLWHFRLRGWEKYPLRIEQTWKHDQMTEDTEAFSWAKIMYVLWPSLHCCNDRVPRESQGFGKSSHVTGRRGVSQSGNAPWIQLLLGCRRWDSHSRAYL